MTARSETFQFLGAITHIEGELARGTFVRNDGRVIEKLGWFFSDIANGPPVVGSIVIGRTKSEPSEKRNQIVATMKARVLSRDEALNLDNLSMEEAMDWIAVTDIPGF